jgi:arylsulfatase A-like enzyme
MSNLWRLLIVLVLLAGCTPDRPNIVLLLSDDQSYPSLGAYGDRNVHTPTLDRLAAEGMKFRRFFTTAPQCVPSRASLMTGRSPVATRMTRFTSPLPRDEITLPEILRDEAGYFTGVCGRYSHLDGPLSGAVDAELIDKNDLRTFASRVDYIDGSKGEGVERKVAEFLDKKPSGRPYFLWVNYDNPHYPWDQITGRPDPASLTLPPHWPDLPGVREELADYSGEVNRLDLQVKAVLDTLEARGALENTLIVFAGDNGLALPHGKGSLYDPGCNVPLLVSWRGVVKPSGDSEVLLSGEDLAPTLLEAAGIEPPVRMSGRSFLPLLRGETYKPHKHVFMERGPHGDVAVTVDVTSNIYDLSRAVRTEHYKLIYNGTPWVRYEPVDSMDDAAWSEIEKARDAGRLAPALVATYFTTPRPVYELYDVRADPSELENLSGTPELTAVEMHLREVLAEKMIRDYDYLPLPDLRMGSVPVEERRGLDFVRLDTDRDGRLSKTEFSAGRDPADARKWFDARDVNDDRFVSRKEYLSKVPDPPGSSR